MSPFAVSASITAIASFMISFVVFTGQKNARTNQAWAATTFLLGLWSLGLFGVVSSDSARTALRWQYLLDASAALIPVGFFLFVVYMLGKEKGHRYFIPLAVLIGLGISALSFTSYFKTGMVPRSNFDFWIEPGPLYVIFPATFIAFVAYSLFLLLREYRRTADPLLRARIVYVLGAQLIGFGGGITNFLPQFVNVYPIGNYFIAFYIFFISYSILRTGLFSLKLIATELFIFSIWLFTLARVFLAESLNERIINAGLFAALIVFGILLVRSVRQEVKAREELQILYSKVEELSRFKTQLLSLASHQLRSPLSAIKGFTELLEDGTYGEIADKPKEVLHKIRHQANELLDLINTLLDLRKVEEGRMEYSFERLDLSQMVRTAVDDLSSLAKQKGIELQYAAGSSVFVKADRKLAQVVRNLIDNSIKYTPMGFVKVSLAEQDGNAVFSVEDSGLGISPELLPHLFEEFQRDERVKKAILGTGLGLYIAKKIMDAHQGRVWAESQGLGKGSRFSMTLPAVK